MFAQEMEKLVSEGLVRSIGVSNFNSVQLQDVLDRATIKPAVNQVQDVLDRAFIKPAVNQVQDVLDLSITKPSVNQVQNVFDHATIIVSFASRIEMHQFLCRHRLRFTRTSARRS